ncbi:DUF3515 domain-containing protein [Mycolicibacterium sp.]|uniref:DUF3515 domain-containing protein n=1 Tax=Mycolicibacterium sp. TaxID=2320850 RepID=UPI0025E3D992|nr:DUF3515 domain-containing protein [Mycolicibacterium sp.]MCB9408550.1 DUF3515 domain-containing protein [Mycolicibacterium sp.]
MTVQGDREDAPPRWLMIAAILLTLTALGTVLAVAASRRSPPAPIPIVAVPAAQASTPECRALLGELPDRLGDYQRAATADPTPAGTAAWHSYSRSEPVILRCGLSRPAEFVVGAPIQMVDDVSWFRLDDPDLERTTWVCVDRPVYVALTLPDGSGPAPIQDLSDVIERTLTQQPIRPGRL